MSLTFSKFPEFETCFVFTEDLNDEHGNRFKSRTFGIKITKGLTAISGILNRKFFLPEIIMVQHVVVEERVRKQEMII